MSGSYAPLFQAAGQQSNVDPRLLAAIAQVESNNNPKAVSKAGALGLMQIMPQTAQALGVQDPTDPTQAVPGAAKLIAQNLDRYGNVADALRAYNAGTDQSHWQNPETEAYVGKVQAAYNALGNQPQGDQQEAQNGASDVPLTSAKPAATPAFDQLFPDLAAAAPDAAPTKGGTPAFDALFPDLASPGAGSAAAASPGGPQAPAPGAAPSAAPTTILGQAAAGVMRGAKDVGDTMDNAVAWGDKNIPGMQALDTGANTAGNALSNALGLPNGNFGRTPAMNNQILANDAAGRAQFQQQSGNSIPAEIGRVAGNALVTAPAIAAGAAAAPVVAGAAGLGELANGIRMAVPAGNLLMKGAGLAAGGAASGAGVGAATSGGYGENPLTAAYQGAKTGAVLGPVAGALGSAVKGVGSAFTGGATDAARATLAKAAVQDFGIPLTGTQIGDSRIAKWAGAVSDSMGGSSSAQAQARTNQAFTQAVSKTFGADAPALTEDVMQNARTNLGNQFDQIAAQTSITPDQPMLNGLIGIQDEAKQVLTTSEQAPLNSQIENVLDAVGPDGSISGQTYQNLTKKNSPLDRAMQNTDPNVAYYAGQIRDQLDGAMARTLEANGQSDLLKQLQATRLQYKNLMTIAPLAQKSVDGTINPALLKGAVIKNFKNGAFQGEGDLGTLADIGQTFLKPLPNSGTADRLQVMGAMRNAAEGAALLATGNPLIAGVHVATPFVQQGVGRLVGAALNRPGTASGVINRSLGAAPQGGINPLLAGAGYGAAIPTINPLLPGPRR